MCELRLLGPVELSCGGGTIRLGGPRQRGLVAFLALNQGRVVSVDEIIDAVWEADAPATVTKSLSTLVSRLRRLLDKTECEIEFVGSGYRFTAPELFTDIAAFRAEVFEAQSAAPPEARALLLRALDRWRGPVMADIAELWFVATLAPVLEDERAAAEDALLRLSREHDQSQQATTLLRSLLARDPTREDRWASLIDLLLADGREEDALEAAATARAALDGVPSRLLRDAEARARGDADESRETLMVGRDADLAELSARVRSVDDSGRLIELVGEVGIGKSTMLEALSSVLRRDGWSVVTLRAERGASVPLGPVFAAFEDAGEGRLLRELHVLGVGPAEVDLTQPVDLARRHVLRAITTAFDRLARRGPLLIAVDDAQWLDELSVAVLRRLLTEGGVPFVCVVTHRPDADVAFDVNQFVVDVRRRGGHVDESPVQLGPLTSAAIERLMRVALPQHADTTRIATRVHEASGGNPLFALQFARSLAERNAGPNSPLEIPSSLGALCDTRLASASAELRAVLAIAAVAGQVFDLPLVAEIAGRSVTATALLCSEAVRLALLRPLDSSNAYEFVHGVIRQHLYESLDSVARAHVHGAFGDALAMDPDQLVEAAWHYLRADRAVPIERIADVVRQAARLTLLLGAYNTAASMVEECRELAADGSAEHARLTVMLAEARFAMGDSRSGRNLLAAGRQAAEKLKLPDAVAEAALSSTRMGLAATGPEARLVAADVLRALELLGDSDPRRSALLWSWRAHLLMNLEPDDAEVALVNAEQALQRVDEGWRVDNVITFARLRQLEASGTDPTACASRARDAMATAQRGLRNDFGLVQAAVALQTARLRAGLFAEVRDDDRRIRDIALRSGRPDMLWLLAAVNSGLALATSSMSEAEAAIEEAAEFGLREGIAGAAVLRLMQLAAVRREQGRLSELEPMLRIAVAASERPGADVLVTQVALEAGDMEAARAGLAATARPEVLRRDWVLDSLLSLGVDIAFAVGDVDYATAAEVRLAAITGQVVVMSSVNQLLGRVDRYLGQAAAIRGDLDLAIERFGTARKLDDAAGSRLWAGWAAHDEALARLTRRQRSDARIAAGLLEDSRAAAVSMESVRLERALDVAEALL